MKLLNNRLASLSAVALCCLSATAFADDVLLHEDFEDMDASGWTANGVVTISEGWGNPGNHLLLPYKAFNIVSLSAREPSSMVLGDLTDRGPMRITTDIQVFQAHNWFNDPLDLTQFPVVIEFVHYGNEKRGTQYSTVYSISEYTWPEQGMGWFTYSFDIPDPASTELPLGWGGTGDEDPHTFEPRLPAGMTYADVMANVDEVRITTAVPGYMYSANFWEVGYDNVIVETVGTGGCAADFNADKVVNSQDFFDFLTAFFGNSPDADFNSDKTVNSQDFFDFLTAFFAGC